MCGIIIRMKVAQGDKTQNIDYLVNLMENKDLLEEKVRVNLYLSRAVVKIIDQLSDNRGELVSKLVIDKFKSKRNLPFGMLKTKTSAGNINNIIRLWNKPVNEL